MKSLEPKTNKDRLLGRQIADIRLGELVLKILQRKFSFYRTPVSEAVMHVCRCLSLERRVVSIVLTVLGKEGKIVFIKNGRSPYIRVIE